MGQSGGQPDPSWPVAANLGSGESTTNRALLQDLVMFSLFTWDLSAAGAQRYISTWQNITFLPPCHSYAIHRNFAELGVLLEKARDFERSVGRRDDLRRIFAFQDEQFPDIGEWSTDRRRQLRNQVGRRSERGS